MRICRQIDRSEGTLEAAGGVTCAACAGARYASIMHELAKAAQPDWRACTQAHGDAGYAAKVDHSFKLAIHFERAINDSSGSFVLVRARSFVNVCFWWIPANLRPFCVRSAAQHQLDLLDTVRQCCLHCCFQPACAQISHKGWWLCAALIQSHCAVLPQMVCKHINAAGFSFDSWVELLKLLTSRILRAHRPGHPCLCAPFMLQQCLLNNCS